MKKPDKIYLNKLMIRPGMLYSAQFPPDETEEVYIRKEALLKWAIERKEQVSIGLNAYDMGEENGKAEILNALIDKLNSL